MDRASNSWRNKRNLNHLNLNGPITFGNMHYSIAPYYTDASKIDKIREDLLNLPRVPDMTKNLADTLVTEEKKAKTTPKMTYEKQNMEKTSENQASESYLTSVFNMFSGIMNAVTVFARRAKSPVRYYDCMDIYDRQGSPALENWQPSNIEKQNKNRTDQLNATNGPAEMASDCRAAIAHCEDKINKVKLLLISKNGQIQPSTRPRRPRKRFIESGSVEEDFVDAFTTEDFVREANVPYLECVSPGNLQKSELIETDSPKTKIEVSVHDMEIVKTLPDKCVATESPTKNMDVIPETKSVSDTHAEVCSALVQDVVPPITENNISNMCTEAPNDSQLTKDLNSKQVISSCEDKLSKLKSLLQEKCKKHRTIISSDSHVEPVKENERPRIPTKSVPIEKTKDKRFKNPHRTSNKRCKAQMIKNIQEDMVFGQEIDSDLSSYENSPSIHRNLQEKLPDMSSMDELTDHDDCFDEVTGRFHSMSSDSEGSFQIVFSDSPKTTRTRKASDCDSEDSFIIFEDSPDSCYTNHDVFGDESDSGTESDDESDSDLEDSDSGRGTETKLSHMLSRTISDLTDDSLYDEMRQCDSEDEVDCAFKNVCEELPDNMDMCVKVDETEVKATGLLIDETKKLLRKNQPPKKVTFSAKPPKVHVMRVWAFAARQARAGHWERHFMDRERFKRRIANVDMAISWVLKPQHRSRVMFQRFMPWWNAQKRKELAEKKQKEEEERLKIEAERKDLERANEEETVIIDKLPDDRQTSQSVIDRTVTDTKCQVTGSVKDQDPNSKEMVETRRSQSESNSRIIAVKN